MRALRVDAAELDLHEFELLPARGVYLSEVLKLSCEMAVPLAVTARPRQAV